MIWLIIWDDYKIFFYAGDFEAWIRWVQTHDSEIHTNFYYE